MRLFLLFVAYLLLALVLGALAAWPLHLILNPFADVPLERIVPRAGMLIALLGAPWFLRRLQLDNRRELGYALPRRAFAGRIGLGLLAGVVILLPLVGVLIGLNVRVLEPDGTVPVTEILETLVTGALAGLLIGFIEETFFRGALYSAVDRAAGMMAAIVLSSLLYAALHFIDLPPADEIAHWYSGLIVLGQAFEPFATPGMIADSFFALFMVGVFLALVRQRTGHIADCIGLHAGWVLTLELIQTLTDYHGEAPLAWLVGDYDHITGLLATLWLAALALLYVRLIAPLGEPTDTAQDRLQRPGRESG